MPVPNKPFWLSQANTEFGGNGWASNIMSKAGLALPRMAGDLAGKSRDSSMSLTIGENSPGYETELGYRIGQMGSILGGQFSGKDVKAINCYDDQPDKLHLSLDGGFDKPIKITIAGLGAAVITPPSTSCTFKSIYSFFAARVGSAVQVTLTAA